MLARAARLLPFALVLACGKDSTATRTPTEAGATGAPAAETPADAPRVDRPAVAPIPEGWAALTPQIVVADVDAAVAFYTEAFEAVPTMTVLGPDGKMFHAEIQIGDTRLLIERESDEWSSPSSTGWTTATLMLYVDDADAVFKRALAAGGKVEMPVEDMFWGDRYGQLIDPAGHRWAVATHVEDLTDAQLQERTNLLGAPPIGGGGKKKGRRRSKGTPAWKSIAGSPARDARPAEYHALTLALTVDDAAAAIEFYTRAFGATERARMPMPDGKLMHAEVQIGDSVLVLSDAFPKQGTKAPHDGDGVPPVMIHHYVDDADATFKAAMGGGAEVVLGVQEVLWGDRFGVVTAPDGYGWGIATQVETLPPDEVARRMQDAAGGPPPPAPPPTTPPAPAPGKSSGKSRGS